MRKTIALFALSTMIVATTSCEKQIEDWSEHIVEDVSEVDDVPMKKFTFTIKGDFKTGSMRGYLQADGKDMTDLWLFDYSDNGTLLQHVYQSSTDEDFGTPTLNLTYGTHHLYFVVSRGNTPTLDLDGKTITWTKPSDTFWKDYDVTVVSTSNGNRAVTLDRVVTRFRATVTDAIPDGVTTITMSPTSWHTGLNYSTGAPTPATTTYTSVMTLPTSYVGQTNTLFNLYGFSGTAEWTTDITITAKTSGNITVGSITVEDVPLKVNRSTDYSGTLFGQSNSLGFTLNSTWDDACEGTW